MEPVPDLRGDQLPQYGRLTGKWAVITGGDSGIGRAVAIALAREGDDVLIAYLNEHEGARDVERYFREAGRKCTPVSGGPSDPAHCRSVIDRAVGELGGIDTLVSNVASR